MLAVWIRDTRFGKPRIQGNFVVSHCRRPAELSLDQGNIVVLEAAEPRNAAALVKDHEQQLAASRVDLACQRAGAAVRITQRSGLAHDASHCEIRIESVLKRSLIDPGNGHNVCK